MKKLTVMLDDELYRATKVEAARQGKALKALVAEALQEWLEVQEDLELAPLVAEARREYEEKGGIELDEAFRRLHEAGQKSA